MTTFTASHVSLSGDVIMNSEFDEYYKARKLIDATIEGLNANTEAIISVWLPDFEWKVEAPENYTGIPEWAGYLCIIENEEQQEAT